MKKQLLLFVLTLLPMLANADAVVIDGIYYNLIAKGNAAEVTFKMNDLEYYHGDMVIPAKVSYEGTEYDVTAIGEGAFSGCRNLTSIIISEGVKSIKKDAFGDCRGLTTVTIPKSLNYVGDAFGNCFSLCTINISDLDAWFDIEFVSGIGGSNLDGETKLFLNGDEVKDVIIPDRITAIPDLLFCYISSITSLTFHEKVRKIGDYAFSGCKGLKSLLIPESVDSLGRDAFSRCTNLQTINIPSGIKEIPPFAFSGCESLKTIELPSNVERIGRSALAGCSGLISITFPDKISTIQDWTVSGCSSLVSVIIGSKVTRICSEAFAYCPKLKDFYCYAEVVPVLFGDDPFKDSYIEYTTLHVPAELVDAYKAAERWNNFKEIIPLTEDDPKATAITAVMRSDKKDGLYYDLSGRKVIQAQKGIFIQNGKKVIVK